MSDVIAPRRAVVKVGTSSITRESGALDDAAIAGLVANVARAFRDGWEIALVTSGAIAAGLPAIGLETRPESVADLQVLAAVGQGRLMERYAILFEEEGIAVGQVLLSASDFSQRANYLNARQALDRMTELGVLPIVNENDTVAVDEIKFGDNDRLAALVAHLVRASALVMLTDTEGLYTADPRLRSEASLIEEVIEIDRELVAIAGGAGTDRSRGGMASKLAAARIATWSGIKVVIAGAAEENVVARILEGESVGTAIAPHDRTLTSKKIWIAFGAAPAGRLIVDSGARNALVERGASLLPVGVVEADGDFSAGEAVEVTDEHGDVFAKGIAGLDAAQIRELRGMNTGDLPPGVRHEVIHRDDLVVLPSDPSSRGP